MLWKIYGPIKGGESTRAPYGRLPADSLYGAQQRILKDQNDRADNFHDLNLLAEDEKPFSGDFVRLNWQAPGAEAF